MKKITAIFSSLALLLLFFGSCKKQTTDPPPPPSSDVDLTKGLLLYLPFDGDITDHSGNNNLTTSVAGGGLAYDEHGYYEDAFGGTGNGERIVVTNNGSIKFDTTLSLSIEVMTRSNTTVQSFIAMINRANSKGCSFGLGIPYAIDQRFDFTTADSSLGCNDNILTTNSSALYSDTLLQPYRFYNIIGTYSKGVQKLYINGRLTDSLTGTSKHIPICPDAQIVVGGWWDSDPETINGVLDNVRLYNRVLNSDEIAELSKDFQE